MLRIFLFLLFFLYYVSYADVIDFFSKIKNHKGLYLSFIQISYIEGFDKSIYEGEAFILKNGKIKIIYKKPQKQYILIDGKKSVSYTPSENQVIISNLDEDISLIKIFKVLSGTLKLKDMFTIKEEQNKVILIPKDKKQINKVVISFEDRIPKEINIYDSDGNLLILKINQIKYLDKNINLNINYPKNTEIIEY